MSFLPFLDVTQPLDDHQLCVNDFISAYSASPCHLLWVFQAVTCLDPVTASALSSVTKLVEKDVDTRKRNFILLDMRIALSCSSPCRYKHFMYHLPYLEDLCYIKRDIKPNLSQWVPSQGWKLIIERDPKPMYPFV